MSMVNSFLQPLLSHKSSLNFVGLSRWELRKTNWGDSLEVWGIIFKNCLERALKILRKLSVLSLPLRVFPQFSFWNSTDCEFHTQQRNHFSSGACRKPRTADAFNSSLTEDSFVVVLAQAETASVMNHCSWKMKKEAIKKFLVSCTSLLRSRKRKKSLKIYECFIKSCSHKSAFPRPRVTETFSSHRRHDTGGEKERHMMMRHGDAWSLANESKLYSFHLSFVPFPESDKQAAKKVVARAGTNLTLACPGALLGEKSAPKIEKLTWKSSQTIIKFIHGRPLEQNQRVSASAAFIQKGHFYQLQSVFPKTFFRDHWIRKISVYISIRWS